MVYGGEMVFRSGGVVVVMGGKGEVLYGDVEK